MTTEEKKEVCYLSVDVGGKNIELCLFDKEYKTIDCSTLSTFVFPPSPELLEYLKDYIEQSMQPSIKKIGISFNCVVESGVFTYSSLMGGKIHYEIEKNYAKHFKIPVHAENDANCMAIAESKKGFGNISKNFVLLNIGNGIRTSCIYNGELFRGYKNNAGEIGSKKVIVHQLQNEVIALDDLVSGKGIVYTYNRLSGKTLTIEDIFANIATDPIARETIDIFSHYLARILEDIARFYNPEYVVIGEILKNYSEHYLPQVFEQLKTRLTEHYLFKDIVISKLDHAACLGAIL